MPSLNICFPSRLFIFALLLSSCVKNLAAAEEPGRVVEGDDGKEKSVGQKGAGGDYAVQCGDRMVQKTVRPGTSVREPLDLTPVAAP